MRGMEHRAAPRRRRGSAHVADKTVSSALSGDLAPQADPKCNRVRSLLESAVRARPISGPHRRAKRATSSVFTSWCSESYEGPLPRTESRTSVIGRESGSEEEMTTVVGVGARAQLTSTEANNRPGNSPK